VNLIIDLRATHGGGKSYIIHTLLERYGNKEIIEAGKLIGHYMPDLGAAVVGPYNRVCGGADSVKSQEDIFRRVRMFKEQYRHVFLEGILVAHTFSSYDSLARELGNYTFCFLNTPLPNCIARVRARRVKKGNRKPLDPKNIIKDHHTVQVKLPGKFREAGHRVVILDWEDPIPQVLELLEKS
jgi:hypothetical protein